MTDINRSVPQPRIPIIGIHGRLESGKTTFAKQIVRSLTHERLVSTINFSDALKEVAFSMGWNGLKDVRGRRMLQLLGTEVGRELINKSIWVRKWKVAAAEALTLQRVVVAEDVRFRNEASTILAVGGLLVKVVRPSVEPPQRKWWQRKPVDHASEVPLEDAMFHYVVENTGERADLLPFASMIAKTVLPLVIKGPLHFPVYTEEEGPHDFQHRD